jgi:hypothetical protein
MNEVLSPTGITIVSAAAFLFFGFVSYWAIKERQSTKAEYYGKSNPGYPHHCLITESTEPVGRKKEKAPPLTQAEGACREILSKLEGDTIWHQAISAALASGTDKEFRNLICQLKSEAYPVPDAMESILGVEAFERVMEL